MSSVVSLLNPQAQDLLRGALEAPQLQQFKNLPDEPLAHLALVGQQPPRLRSAALAILPIGPRSELQARRLLDFDRTTHAKWTLTEAGEKLAEVLAATAPTPSEDEERDAAKRLAAQLEEAERRFGYRD